MENTTCVYLIQSQSDRTIYIGCTNNLTRRIEEHNSGFSQYTKAHIPWELKWYATFFDKETAFAFEKYLKTSSGKAFLRKRLYKIT